VALAKLASQVFQERKFDEMKTAVGIVATRWVSERPMIFKTSIEQAHGRKGTFSPGFGVAVSDAVQASCSAFPFFDRKVVTTDKGDQVELIDGGYCANNPTLYAIADALMALRVPRELIRVVSVGVGAYPPPKHSWFESMRWKQKLLSVQLLQKTLEINTQSMDQLRHVLFQDISTVRISDTFQQPEMATDLFEHNMMKLNILRQRGGESFAKHERALRELLL
jgi:predicted acylesterase/phospholipase RssA